VKIINLGCGTKTSDSPDVINIDWSMYLRFRRSPILRRAAPLLLSAERRKRFETLPANVVVHDLRQGIPCATDSVDVVYHSHLLEHLDRPSAEVFQTEVHRVLVPGGIQRIVVPDLETLAREYLEHVDLCEREPGQRPHHDRFVANMLEQCVRTEGRGTREQPPLQRWLENRLLGDARRRGETHQWMYDRFNLSVLLDKAGFVNTRVHRYNTSSIPGWNGYALDLAEDGAAHKRRSLYVEAEKAPRRQ
jgi:SAM-dependent methyltransferase